MPASEFVITARQTVIDPAERARRLAAAYEPLETQTRLGRALALLVAWGREARAEEESRPDANVSEASALGRAGDVLTIGRGRMEVATQ